MINLSRTLLITLVLTLLGCQHSSQNDQVEKSSLTNNDSRIINLMTFNIRNGRAADGENHWNKRKQLVFNRITEQSADVIGIQEAFRFQLEEINKSLPEFKEIGEGRAGGINDEYSAILYRHDKYSVKDSGTFWLSDTPTVPSKNWGNSHIRICTWARLIDKASHETFYIYNTHLDNRSQLSREKSVIFIANVISKRPYKDPFTLMGDFNAGENNKAILYLMGNKIDTNFSPIKMVDSYRAIHPNEKQVGTFNHFEGRTDGPKIDYIFVDPNSRVVDSNILRMNNNGRYPSDHFPLTTKIRLR